MARGQNEPDKLEVEAEPMKLSSSELKSSFGSKNDGFVKPGNHYMVKIEKVITNKEEVRSRDSDDKSRSLCKSIEEKVKVCNAAGNGAGENLFNHQYLFSKETEAQKAERSLLKTKGNLDDPISAHTINESLSGKLKDALHITQQEELVNTELFSRVKYKKTIVQL